MSPVKHALAERRVITCNFLAIVPAGSERSYTSYRINAPIRTKEIAVSFALNTNRTLQVGFFISDDDETPNGKPGGFNLLSNFGPADYLVGDDDRKVLRHEVDLPNRGHYLKIYAKNTDGVSHTLDAQFTVELFPDGSK